MKVNGIAVWVLLLVGLAASITVSLFLFPPSGPSPMVGPGSPGNPQPLPCPSTFNHCPQGPAKTSAAPPTAPAVTEPRTMGAARLARALATSPL